jgi:RNA polymerase sigma-70 factor (ECF subfamily)
MWTMQTMATGADDAQTCGSDLIRRLVAGEAAAFDEMANLYASRIAALSYRLLGWSGDVDDVVQEVLMIVLQKAGDFRAESSLWTWLAAITVNRCRDHQRRMRVRRFLSRGLSLLAPPADRAAMDDETAGQVRVAVSALSPKLREVIVLYYLQGMSTAEICEIVGASTSAVEVRLHRGRIQLRSLLSKLSEELKR